MIRGLLRRPTPRHDDCGWNSPTHTDIALISELRNNSRVRVGGHAPRDGADDQLAARGSDREHAGRQAGIMDPPS